MKKLLLSGAGIVAVCAALVLGACATVGLKTPEPLPVPASLSPAQKTAAILINEALVNLTAAYDLVDDLAKGKLILKSEGKRYLAALDDAKSKLAKARALYQGGDILNAKTQAEVLNKGLVLLLQQLNKKKGGK